MEHDWEDERHADPEGREWEQVCRTCGMRRRFHATPKGARIEVVSSVDQDCSRLTVKSVMRS